MNLDLENELNSAQVDAETSEGKFNQALGDFNQKIDESARKIGKLLNRAKRPVRFIDGNLRAMRENPIPSTLAIFLGGMVLGAYLGRPRSSKHLYR